MKKIKIFLAVFIAISTLQFANAQSDKATARDAFNNHTKSQTIKVYGECGMCKHRIEKAALTVDGIKSAIWDVDTKMLLVTYDSFKKTAIDSVQKKIASVGHDTEKYSATNTAYNSLPDCCHYARKLAKQ
jgi:copper chaperone CopZ